MYWLHYKYYSQYENVKYSKENYIQTTKFNDDYNDVCVVLA